MIEAGAKVKYKNEQAEVIDVIEEENQPTLYYVRTTKGECVVCRSQQIELLPNQERAAST
jgi:hypothetical protein